MNRAVTAFLAATTGLLDVVQVIRLLYMFLRWNTYGSRIVHNTTRALLHLVNHAMFKAQADQPELVTIH
jgi:accessory gene regulator protein AgrB